MDELLVDTDRIDDAVLALLLLGTCERGRFSEAVRVWKSFDWDVMARLHARGMIEDPVNKAKSVWLTEEGAKRAEELFDTLFRRQSGPA